MYTSEGENGNKIKNLNKTEENRKVFNPNSFKPIQKYGRGTFFKYLCRFLFDYA